MTEPALVLIFLVLVTLGLLGYWYTSLRGHRRRMNQLAVRVHVNGIRGKSTVTRLVAAILRDGGFVTVAKTTGSAARVIGPDGSESAVSRRGAATILEQVDVVAEHVVGQVDALVIECMAVRPLYQQYAEDQLIRSDITIITNIRMDHQEEMGETLEEIADSLSLTIPRGGVLITAEERTDLRERLARNAAKRGSDMVYADPASVDGLEMAGFEHLEFRENVAIGLEVARQLGINRDMAMRAMRKAVPDVGAVRLHRYAVGAKQVLWIPLFAVNDRESVLLSFDQLEPRFVPGSTVIAVVNNRADRGRRAELFARIIALDLPERVDQVITFGAYEDQVTRQMVALGFPSERITNLGDSVGPALDQILVGIERLTPGDEAVLIGMANIHTHQAELLIEYFGHLLGAERTDELVLSRDPLRLPKGAGRLRRARTHRIPRSATPRDA
ncbi:MAG: poly-gamma-glutamate synthase PgsB [Chloroflexi bacterium]|nr:poly-gamma-glutamate synthase PgsB [Chloroflexota bacterium]